MAFSSLDVTRVYLKRINMKKNEKKVNTTIYKKGNSLVINLSFVKNIVAISGVGYMITAIFLAIATK